MFDNNLIKTLPQSKGDKTKEKMIIAAIEVISSTGVFSFSYESIAKKINTSRQHVRNAFSGKIELISEVARYLRLEYQNAVLNSMDFSKEPELLFRSYISAALRWPLQRQSYSAAWLAFLCCAATDAELRKLHSEMSTIGAERIAALIGRSLSARAKSNLNLLHRALMVQALISGALITIATENLAIERDLYLEIIEKECFALGRNRV